MWGQSEARALDMLADRINASGGIAASRSSSSVRQPKRGVESVNVAGGVRQGGGGDRSGSGGNAIASAPVFEAEIPMVVTTATNRTSP